MGIDEGLHISHILLQFLKIEKNRKAAIAQGDASSEPKVDYASFLSPSVMIMSVIFM